MAKIGSWDFTKGSGQDSTGLWGGLNLHGSASLTTQGLKVGSNSWATVEHYTGSEIQQMTLMVWMKLNHFTTTSYVKDVSAITIHTVDKISEEVEHVDYDGISFRDGNHYVLHKDMLSEKPTFLLSERQDLVVEKNKGKLIQLALVYSGTAEWEALTQFYINGIQILQPMHDFEHRKWQAGKTRIVFGQSPDLSSRSSGSRSITRYAGNTDLMIVRAALYDEAIRPEKIGAWDFTDGVGNDATGNWGALQLKGATLSTAGLKIAQNQWATSPNYTGPEIQDKTVVVYAKVDSLANSNAGDGAAISVHNSQADQHDCIAFGIDHANTWSAESTTHRHEGTGATPITNLTAAQQNTTGEMTQLIAVYKNMADNVVRVKLYRDGTLVEEHTKPAIRNLASGLGNSEILFGPRFTEKEGVTAENPEGTKIPTGYFDGTIVRADMYGKAMDLELLPDNVQAKSNNQITYAAGAAPVITVQGIEGGVFVAEPRPAEAVRLWEVHFAASNNTRLTTDATLKDTWIAPGGGGALTANEMWVYPKKVADLKKPGMENTVEGLVPLHAFYDATKQNHFYTSDPQKIEQLKHTTSLTNQGIVCNLLPLSEITAEATHIAPLIRIHRESDDNTVHLANETALSTELLPNVGLTQPTIGTVTLEPGSLLDAEFFSEHFDDVGAVLGEVFALLDMRVQTYTHRTEQADPYWATLLRKKGLVPAATLTSFQKTVKVYTWTTTIKNLADPSAARISVEVELKIFGGSATAGAQLKFKLPGEHCLDDVVPAMLRKGQSLPVIGQFNITDLTFVYATAETLYDPGLDASILAGFNLYANFSFDPPAGKELPPVMDMVSKVTGVKNAAFHLGLGIEKAEVLKIAMVAELALQWRQYNIAPVLTAPVLQGQSGLAETSVPAGFSMPSIKTQYFALRFSRSDIKIAAELGIDGGSVSFGFSTDLAIEIEKLGNIVPKTYLVFTGGATVGTGFELPGGDDDPGDDADGADDPSFDVALALTMNGTGRSTSGVLSGENPNTTSLAIGNPPFLELKQAALEFGVGVSGKTLTPNLFGVQAKGSFFSIEGEIAFKIDVGTPQAFLLIIDINQISLTDMLKFGMGIITGTALTAIATVLPNQVITAVETILDVSLKDVLVYLVPVKNSIGGVIYEDTGLAIGAKLDLWGWQARMYGIFDLDRGVVFSAELDPIDLKIRDFTVFSLGRSLKAPAVPVDPNSAKEQRLTGGDASKKGPRFDLAVMKPDGSGSSSKSLVQEASITLKGDARFVILGVSLDVYLSLANGRFDFSTELSAGPLTIAITGAYHPEDLANNRRNYLQFGGTINVGLTLPSVDLPLYGTVKLDGISFSAGVNFKAWQAASGPNQWFSFSAYVRLSVLGLAVNAEYETTAGFEFSSLDDLLIEAVKTEVLGLVPSPSEWVDAIEDGVVYVGNQARHYIETGFNQTIDTFSQGLSQAGKTIDEIGDFLHDTVHVSDKELAKALKYAGGVVDDVGNFLKNGVVGSTQYTIGVALNFAGFSAEQTGNYLRDAFSLGPDALNQTLVSAGFSDTAIKAFYLLLPFPFNVFFITYDTKLNPMNW